MHHSGTRTSVSRAFQHSILAVCLLSSASSVFAATPISASLSLSAVAQFDQPEVVDIGNDAWGQLLAPLSASASAIAPHEDGTSAVDVHGFGSANWIGANQGIVSLSDVGWDFFNAEGNARVNGSLNWTYSFVAESDGSFDLHADVTGEGRTFGLQVWIVAVIGGPEGLQLKDARSGTSLISTWDFVAELTAGSEYTARLVNDGNISAIGIQTFSGTMNGTFHWRILPVPEPTAGALLITGLVTSGLLVSRRR